MGAGPSQFVTLESPNERYRAQVREKETAALLLEKSDNSRRWRRTFITSAVMALLTLVVTLYLM